MVTWPSWSKALVSGTLITSLFGGVSSNLTVAISLLEIITMFSSDFLIYNMQHTLSECTATVSKAVEVTLFLRLNVIDVERA